MTDRPIIFSGAMVRALLEGRKTMTRRLLEIRGHKKFHLFDVSDTKGYDWHFRDKELRWHDLRHNELLKRLPYAVGDRLYVRESFKVEPGGHIPDGGGGQMDYIEPSITYRADTHWDGRRPGFWGKGWTPSIHMPRNFSRITLTVTAVKVERLQDINGIDAVAEGIPLDFPGGHHGAYHRAVGAFRTLWDSLNAKRAPWDSNPWVVVPSFSVAKINIDQLAKE